MTLRRRQFLGAGLAGVAVALAPTLAHATEVSVQATLGASQVAVGEAVYLQIEVETDGQSISAPEFPALANLEIEARGTSSGFSASFGTNAGTVRHSTKTFTYVVSPLAPGEYELAVEVEIDGKRYKPAKVPKLVATGTAAAALVAPTAVGKAGDQPDDPESEVIVWPVVDAAEVYVGQQLVYELQIWERTSGNLSISGAPTFKDFWSEDLDVPPNNRRNLPRTDLAPRPTRLAARTTLRFLSASTSARSRSIVASR